MAQSQPLALPAPSSTETVQDLEHQILQLRTKLAFVNDKNHMLQAQIDPSFLNY